MWEDDLENAARRKVVWVAAAVTVAVVGFGGWQWYAARHRVAAPPPVAAAPAAALVNTAPAISHPIPGDAAGAAALPALADSDQLVRDSLAGVVGHDPIARFLVPQNLVRHIVVSADNLPRRKLAVGLRPLRPTAGQTVTATQGDLVTLGEANFARYAPLARVAQSVDVKALAVVYQRLYPLFQQAYEDLGYPDKYFNDRLVEVIDHLLEAPEVAAPIPLVQPKVFYEYADASLEARSAGQKLLVRMGPANARIIKAKLQEFRAEIVNRK
ncbi:MAG: DUF3014 domain-containing protein [Steroidobacteraceae bacterium]